MQLPEQSTIVYGNHVIGRSLLRIYDEGMGVLGGRFEPTENFHMVADVFQLFADAINHEPKDKAMFDD